MKYWFISFHEFLTKINFPIFSPVEIGIENLSDTIDEETIERSEVARVASSGGLGFINRSYGLESEESTENGNSTTEESTEYFNTSEESTKEWPHWPDSNDSQPQSGSENLKKSRQKKS